MSNCFHKSYNWFFDTEGPPKKYVHDCRLSTSGSLFSGYIPNDQIYQQRFRLACLMSSEPSHRRCYAKSRYGTDRDRKYHLKTHFYIIHPFSELRYYWEIFMVFVYLVELISVPYIALLSEANFLLGMSCVLVLGTLCFGDIGVSFATGYYESAWNIVVLNPKWIAKKYLLSYLIPDLLATIPVSYILHFFDYTDIIVRVLHSMKLFHLFKLYWYLELIRRKRQYSLHKCLTLYLMLLLFISFNWVMYFKCLALMQDYNLKISQLSIVQCQFLAIDALVGNGQVDVLLFSTELFVHSISHLFGILLKMLIMIQIVLWFKSKYHSQQINDDMMNEINEYVHFKSLPPETGNKIMNYYNFFFEHVYFNEKDIWSRTLQEVKSEMYYYILKDLTTKDIFSLCPKEMVESLMSSLHRIVYLPNSEVQKAGATAKYLFFIYSGSVVLHTADKVKVGHLEEGRMFTDAALLETSATLRYTALTTEFSEIYKLNYKYIHEAVQDTPTLMHRLQAILQRRHDLLEQAEGLGVDWELYFSLEEQ